MHQVTFKESAVKEVKKLPKDIKNKMRIIIQDLSQNPRPRKCKKLAGGTHAYRIRIGDYRILYVIDDDKKWISISAVRHRKEAYR